MANLYQIDKSIVENPDFTNSAEDITINVNIGDGESVSFVAQKEFFTPRRIATNRGEVALMENVVELTPANVPVVKMPGINQDITNPQYYLNSIVSDQYQSLPIDKYFLELDNDLAPPPFTGSLVEQRELALNTLLNLQEEADAARIGDPTAYTEAAAQVDENYAALAGLQNIQELTPAEILSADEADQLAALSLVGVTNIESSDISADIINPPPEVNDSDLIRFGNKIPLLQGKTAGTDTINAAIKLLNSGVQAIESSSKTGMTEDGKCKYITIAKGKKGGVFGIGAKKYETKVSREETQKRLDLVKEDIAAQQASSTTIIQTKSGVATCVQIRKSTLLGKIAGKGFLAATIGWIAAPFTAGASLALVAAGTATAVGAATVSKITGAKLEVPKGYKPMTKEQALKVLNATKDNLESILAKDCE